MATQIEDKQKRLQELRSEVQRLEQELQSREAPRWRGGGYYTAYYATAGFMLGMLGAATSLLLNVVGALIAGEPPLKLIQVYLTFPLGEKALTMEDGMTLAIGCCLYLATGMLFGMIFHLVLTRISNGSPDYPLRNRMVVTSILAVALWAFNFYGVLSWLQPLLFGGSWIVDEIPIWVGLLTHLVFGWTMALVYPLGVYLPYRLQTEQA